MAGQQAEGLPAPSWLAGDDSTFKDALVVGLEARKAAAEVLPTLGRKDATRHFPSTMSDALSLVHAREDAKKKNAANKSAKSKHKSLGTAHLDSDTHFPGAIEGGGDPSAFWMYLEDFFRDTTQEDLHDILPMLLSPEDDPAFHLIPPGSRTDMISLPSSNKKTGTFNSPALPPVVAPRPTPLSRTATAATDLSTPGSGGGLDGTGSPSERRSRRLVTKQSRDMQRFFIDDDDVALEAMALEANESKSEIAAAIAAANAAAMTVPLTAGGVPAHQLWELLPDRQLAMLAVEFTELASAAGQTKSCSPLDAACLKAAKDAMSSSNGPITALKPDLRGRIIAWLEQQSTKLAGELGCKIDFTVLGLRRGSAAPAGAGGDHDYDEDEDAHEHLAGPSSSGGNPSDSGHGYHHTTTTAEGAAAAPPPTEVVLPSPGFIHPYTKLMLKTKVPPHICQAAVDPLPHDPLLAGKSTPAAGLVGEAATGTATPAGLATPTPSSLGGGGIDRPGSALNIVDSMPSGSEALDEDDGEGGDGQTAQGGGGRAGGRHRSGGPNYALMAGRKDPAKIAAQIEARKLTQAATNALIVQAAAHHPIAQAVASAVASGAPEGPASAQFDLATRDPALLAAAPYDEIAAETLALQVELATVAISNRTRLVQALNGMLEDLPRQRAAAEIRAKERSEVEEWIRGIREAKTKEQKLRREAAHREALVHAGAQKGPDGLHSPRPVLGRHGGLEASPAEGLVEAPFLGPDEMYDVLAVRREEDEAFCAVCGDGSSVEPNVILFCDRCDVAVHQRCYDVLDVPENEWLCWPCREYEEQQRALGVPQATVRPPHMMPEDRRQLPGGARDAKCLLCPIKCGAFRRTADGQHWVHQTCALWHPETYLLQNQGPNVVDGIARIPAKKWTTPCDICGKAEGAVVNCKHPGTCQYAFHVLCARNCGLYLTVRKDFQGRPQYRIYCAVHSKGQQDKDERAAIVALEGQQKAASAAQDKAARDELKRLELEELAGKEEELARMHALRVNLESCRILLDRCTRREKVKKQLLTTNALAFSERLQDPVAALEFIERLKGLDEMELSPAQQIEVIFNTSGGGGAAAPGVEAQAGGAGVVGRQTRTTISLTKRQRAAGSPVTTPAAEIAAAKPTEVLSDRAKRARRGYGSAATPPLPPSGPSAADPLPPPAPPSSAFATAVPTATEAPPSTIKPPSTAIATADDGQQHVAGDQQRLIARTALLHRVEAEQLNKALPANFKYVPAHELSASAAVVVQGQTDGQDAAGSGGRPSRSARGRVTSDDADVASSGAEPIIRTRSRPLK